MACSFAEAGPVQSPSTPRILCAGGRRSRRDPDDAISGRTRRFQFVKETYHPAAQSGWLMLLLQLTRGRVASGAAEEAATARSCRPRAGRRLWLRHDRLPCHGIGSHCGGLGHEGAWRRHTPLASVHPRRRRVGGDWLHAGSHPHPPPPPPATHPEWSSGGGGGGAISSATHLPVGRRSSCKPVLMAHDSASSDGGGGPRWGGGSIVREPGPPLPPPHRHAPSEGVNAVYAHALHAGTGESAALPPLRLRPRRSPPAADAEHAICRSGRDQWCPHLGETQAAAGLDSSGVRNSAAPSR